MHRGIVINQARRLADAAPLDAAVVDRTDHLDAACAGSAVDGETGRAAFVFTSDVDRAREDPGVRGLGLAGRTRLADHISCVARLITDRGDAAERGAAIFVISFSVPDDDLALFDEWYELDHSTILLTADGWLRIRRYEPVELDPGWTWNRLAVHELRSTDVWNVPQRTAARETPLRARVAARPWFATSRRWMYELDERFER